jgi:hypothetical protein
MAKVAPVLVDWSVFGAAVEKVGEDIWANALPQNRYSNRNKFTEQIEWLALIFIGWLRRALVRRRDKMFGEREMMHCKL